MPGGERGDGLGRGGRVPRPRERGRRTRLGLFGLCRFFGQTLAAVCPAASGATVSAEAGGCRGRASGAGTRPPRPRPSPRSSPGTPRLGFGRKNDKVRKALAAFACPARAAAAPAASAETVAPLAAGHTAARVWPKKRQSPKSPSRVRLPRSRGRGTRPPRPRPSPRSPPGTPRLGFGRKNDKVRKALAAFACPARAAAAPARLGRDRRPARRRAHRG